MAFCKKVQFPNCAKVGASLDANKDGKVSKKEVFGAFVKMLIKRCKNKMRRKHK